MPALEPNSRGTVSSQNAYKGVDKVAILLRTLGEEAATEVVKQLNEEEVKEIGTAMKRLGSVSPEQVEEIVLEFHEKISTEGGLVFGDEAFLRELLHNALGEDRARTIMGEISDKTGSVLRSMQYLDPRSIANFLRNEHPQTTALVLSYINADHSAEILSQFPDTLQVEIVTRLANLESVSPEMIGEIEEVIRDEMKSLGLAESKEIGGVSAAVELINRMDRTSATQLIEGIYEADSNLAENIQQMMFVFDDLVNLDKHAVQQILKEVSNDELIMALKTASEEIKDMIFGNLSERAREMIKEDMDVMGPVRLRDVEAAQRQMVQVARKLEEEGKIQIQSAGEEDVMV